MRLADWGRRSWLIGLATALALFAGWTAALSSGAAALVIPLVLVGISFLTWRQAQLRDWSLERLQTDLRNWRERNEIASRIDEPVEEFQSLRAELAAVQQWWVQTQEQRQQELASLERDAALAQMILGTMVEGVAVLDGRSQFLYVNRAARRLLELAARDVSGRLLHELVRNPQLHELVDLVLSSQREQQSEVVLSRRERTVQVWAGVLPLDPTPGVVLVLHDVTELRRLEQVRRDFASNVSHELKTPLTSIQAYADSLLEGALEDPAVNRGFVERILQQSERLERLIFDLLNLSRVESQDERLELETIDLAQLAQDALPPHVSVAEGRELTLRSEIAGTPVLVRGDREGLQTILDNLVRNACSYTPAGGTVTVRTRQEEGEGVLEVQDTGVGIPRDLQQRVFERFFRVDKARAREVGGTGLGLSIVKHLVELCGGRVEVESEPGRGSLFRVRLTIPVAGDESQPESGESVVSARREISESSDGELRS